MQSDSATGEKSIEDIERQNHVYLAGVIRAGWVMTTDVLLLGRSDQLQMFFASKKGSVDIGRRKIDFCNLESPSHRHR